MWIKTCIGGFTEDDRRVVRRCRKAMMATLLIYYALNWWLGHLGGVQAEVVAGVMGAVFFTLMFLFAVLVVRSGDEFRRALLLKSLLWATVLTMFLVFVIGFVEAIGHGSFHVPLLSVPAFLITATAVAKLLVFRRHRVARDEQVA